MGNGLEDENSWETFSLHRRFSNFKFLSRKLVNQYSFSWYLIMFDCPGCQGIPKISIWILSSVPFR